MRSELWRQTAMPAGEAGTALFEYIELFYNRRRRHTSPGYVGPGRYERPYESGELTTDRPAG